MLSKELQLTLSNAFSLANEYEHEYVTLEHLLLELLGLPSVREAIEACGVKLTTVESELEKYLDSEAAGVKTEELLPTMAFQRVIERAIYLVQSNGYTEVTGLHVLASIFSEQDSHAVYVLESCGVHRVDILSYISHGVTAQQQEDFLTSSPSEESIEDAEVGESENNPITNYSVNLNEEVEMGRIEKKCRRKYRVQLLQDDANLLVGHYTLSVCLVLATRTFPEMCVPKITSHSGIREVFLCRVLVECQKALSVCSLLIQFTSFCLEETGIRCGEQQLLYCW